MTYRTPEQTAAWMAQRLEALGMNQDQLAAAAGINPANLSRYKSHKQRPGIDQVQRLALALDVDVVTLLVELGAIDPSAKSTPTIIADEDGAGLLVMPGAIVPGGLATPIRLVDAEPSDDEAGES